MSEDLAVDGSELWDGYADARDRDLRRLYGLKQAHYDQLVELQEGRCGICGTEPPEGQRLVVDEDHDTRAIRGLLCPRCNRRATQTRARYYLNPPAGHLGWVVPEKNWNTRQARNAARGERKRKEREAAMAEAARPGPPGAEPSILEQIREMTRPDPDADPDAYAAATERALAETATPPAYGWSEPPPRPEPPPEPEPRGWRRWFGR